MALEGGLERLYRERFGDGSLTSKNSVWQILCGSFFQNLIPDNSTVLDMGAGYCEFINNIKCQKKFAVDLNKQTPQFANPDVTVICNSSTKLDSFQNNSIDVVFMSNFLEHLNSKDEVQLTLAEALRVLKSKSILMILQPNIRFLYKEYWDFFDHIIPLSDKSLVEILQVIGFDIEKVIPKFLPYTTKSRLPKNPFLIKFYLNFPLAWKILGKQAFILARKP